MSRRTWGFWLSWERLGIQLIKENAPVTLNDFMPLSFVQCSYQGKSHWKLISTLLELLNDIKTKTNTIINHNITEYMKWQTFSILSSHEVTLVLQKLYFVCIHNEGLLSWKFFRNVTVYPIFKFWHSGVNPGRVLISTTITWFDNTRKNKSTIFSLNHQWSSTITLK